MTSPRRAREVYITRGARRAAAGLLLLTLITGGGNLLATYLDVRAAQQAQHREQEAQQRQGVITERKICTTMSKLAALSPPAGNARANPSRAFEQQLHATLDQLGPDLGCR